MVLIVEAVFIMVLMIILFLRLWMVIVQLVTVLI